MSAIDQLLSREKGCTAAELLSCDEFSLKFYQRKQSLIEFLFKRESVLQMLHLISDSPPERESIKRKFVLPKLASDVLCDEIPAIRAQLVSSECLNVLLGFFEQKKVIQPLYAQHMCKVALCLIRTRGDEILQEMQKRDTVVKMLGHIDCYPICELIDDIASAHEVIESDSLKEELSITILESIIWNSKEVQNDQLNRENQNDMDIEIDKIEKMNIMEKVNSDNNNMIQLLSALLRSEIGEDVDQAFIRSHAMRYIMDIFFRYPNCSIMHCEIYTLLDLGICLRCRNLVISDVVNETDTIKQTSSQSPSLSNTNITSPYIHPSASNQCYQLINLSPLVHLSEQSPAQSLHQQPIASHVLHLARMIEEIREDVPEVDNAIQILNGINYNNDNNINNEIWDDMYNSIVYPAHQKQCNIPFPRPLNLPQTNIQSVEGIIADGLLGQYEMGNIANLFGYNSSGDGADDITDGVIRSGWEGQGFVGVSDYWSGDSGDVY
ncbi:MAG: hypothetical protein EZS28_004115 [Streblomastix strix]|uniref:Uncharacterized protein n=1 Tax=Streblomastix strix TaxID=222440 RepID=A0A5J4WZ13_9EUKA|nr:MAG: hypothetical protein EZS28_004115 [Streblomastix strix]